ncbi:hypothetical protein ACM46_19640 [Chryseobacterium angstadtii]|uniref:Uncharacterized protein n=1 Tax=Chryseobacterium angstadtii TaxID=558151 RepID=A0A0J7HYL4_9FLAO|nr:hypothetical protein ACM46_19640 [Chryseobacterium angstadtii]
MITSLYFSYTAPENPHEKYRENTDVFFGRIVIHLQRTRGKNTKETRKMNAEEKLINRENRKTAGPKGRADSSFKKTKTQVSNSFLQRIISLLKKEELI